MLRGWSMADVQMGLTWGIICDSVVEDGANISWKCRRRNCTSEVEEVTVVGYALSRGTEVQFCLLSSLFSFSLLRDIRLVHFRQAFLYFGETAGLFHFFHFLLVFQTFQKGTSNCFCSSLVSVTGHVNNVTDLVIQKFRLLIWTDSRQADKNKVLRKRSKIQAYSVWTNGPGFHGEAAVSRCYFNLNILLISYIYKASTTLDQWNLETNRCRTQNSSNGFCPHNAGGIQKHIFFTGHFEFVFKGNSVREITWL